MLTPFYSNNLFRQSLNRTNFLPISVYCLQHVLPLIPNCFQETYNLLSLEEIPQSMIHCIFLPVFLPSLHSSYLLFFFSIMLSVYPILRTIHYFQNSNQSLFWNLYQINYHYFHDLNVFFFTRKTIQFKTCTTCIKDNIIPDQITINEQEKNLSKSCPYWVHDNHLPPPNLLKPPLPPL